MKKLTVFLCTFALLLGGVGVAQAASMYYTFEGSVTLVTGSDSIYTSQGGPSVGDAVSYTFEIDLDKIGSTTTFGGTTTDKAGSYFADYVGDFTDTGGSALPEPADPYYGANAQIGAYNYVSTNAANTAYWIWTGSLNNLLQITALGSPGTPDSWDASTTVRAYNRFWHKSGTGAGVFTNVYANKLILADISDIDPTGGKPVPEPATMLLLGAGLVGLAGFGRKKFLKKS